MNNPPTKTIKIFNAVYNIPDFVKNIFKIILRIDNPDIAPIIYIIVVILVIVQIILFINACLNYTKYEKNKSENDMPLFEKYPIFEYLKDENVMDIDAFFLKYDCPFPYIFIWYPFLIALCLLFSKHYNANKIMGGNNGLDNEHVFGYFIALLFLFIAYYFAFNFAVNIPIKNKIEEFEKDCINKSILNFNTNNDIAPNYKVNRQKILKILKHIIISDMEKKNFTLNIETIATQIKDQLNVATIDKDYIKTALNAVKKDEDKDKISILELIYIYGDKGVINDDDSRIKYINCIDKYFSLLINENIEGKKINYSMYYLLGLSSTQFVQDNPEIFKETNLNEKFKDIIIKLNELLDKSIYVNIKIYYVAMIVVYILIILILIYYYVKEIMKAFSYFCREFKLDRIKVVFIAVIVIIIFGSFGAQAGVYKYIRDTAKADTEDTDDYESAETKEREAWFNPK